MKLLFRLRRYLAQRRMPSLPDALRCAADHGHQVVLELLLHLRANPNVPADSGAHGVGFTQVGAYPLHLAAKRGRLEVMEVLLKAGACIDAADQNGRTGLMVAAASGQHSAILWLLCHRAAADSSTHYGYTALHYAALVPRPEVVHALLEGRASSNVVDREGRSALHAALSTLPRARTEGAAVSTSCDPSGIGDEYCYENDISHGYRRNEQEEAQVQAVQTAVTALMRHGADAELRDGSGRSAIDVVQDKRRADLAEWLRKLSDPGCEAAGPLSRATLLAYLGNFAAACCREQKTASTCIPASHAGLALTPSHCLIRMLRSPRLVLSAAVR